MFMKLPIASVKYCKSNYAPVVNRWYYTASSFYTRAYLPVTTQEKSSSMTDRHIRCYLLDSFTHVWKGESIAGKTHQSTKKPQIEPIKLLLGPSIFSL